MPQPSTVQSAIDRGVDRKTLKQLRKRFLQVNDARLSRTRSALGVRQQVFLDLLPLLFHVNHPMLPGYVSHHTPAGLSDYNPSKQEVRKAQRLARSFTYRRQPTMQRQIHSLFLMGSCGTVAQSDSSDLDFWVCHPDELDSEAVMLLKLKCDDISKWARSLGLEAHFFLMAGEKFRLGEREALSAENCGTSQHYLLLDEFYRTGLLLAGRIPIWWLVPPEEEIHYDHYADTLRQKRFVKPTDTIDFGGVAHIPAGEFIGAGVWQLYKAIDSPYKSAIKLLLTEVYASEYPDVEPLSSSFKRAIYADKLDIDELDPYVIMYRKLERYLLDRGEDSRLDLVRRCFYFKVGKALSRGPSSGVKSWQRLLMERLVREWQWPPEKLYNLDARAKWKVGRVVTEQKALVRELTNSYRFLLDFARLTQTSALINSQEMTVLGRKLYATFERKAGKVEWVNPGISPQLAEETLSFCQLPSGSEGEPAWAVVAEPVQARELPRSQPLKRSKDLLGLLAWCHVNGLMDAGTQLHIVAGEHTISEFELHNMVRTLRRQLRPRRTESEADALLHNQFSRPSHPTEVQLFINVGTDPLTHVRSRGLERLSDRTDSLVYSGLRDNLVVNIEQLTVNSWGEVTTRRYDGAQALVQCLRDYLQMLPPEARTGLPRLTVSCFCPTRSTAIKHRVEELFRDIAACYYSGTRPAGTRYVLEIQREFFTFQFERGQPLVQRAGNYLTLLEQLGREQRDYSPIVLDRYCLQGAPLTLIAAEGQADTVQVFYQHTGERAQLYILDERGSLYHAETAFYDMHTLLQPLQQFFQSLLYRRHGEARGLADADAETLPEDPLHAIEYYEIAGGQLLPRQVNNEDKPGDFFNVQAIGDYDNHGRITFNIYCDQQEFNELELGDALYDTVARSILSRRKSRQRYPCYITDLDLSRCTELNRDGNIQTVHYLHFKQRLERALNQALAKL